MPQIPLDIMIFLATFSSDDLWNLFQSIDAAKQSDQQCAICMCPLGTSSPGLYGHLDNCVHTFCATCLLKWSAARVQPAQRTCPACRTIFRSILFWPRVISGLEKEQVFRFQNAPQRHVQGLGVPTVERQAGGPPVILPQTGQQQAAVVQVLDRGLFVLEEQANITQQMEQDAHRIAEQALEQARIGGAEALNVALEAARRYGEARENARQAAEALNQYRNRLNR